MNLIKLFSLNHLRLERILLGAYVILATMTVVLTAWYLLSERDLLLRSAELQIGSLTRALEEHALRTFSAVDGQLRQVSRRILDRGALEAQDSASILPLLKETAARLSFVRAVYVDDRFGRGHTSSLGTNIRSFRARDFEYIRPLYDIPTDDRLSIGLPSKGSLSGRGNLPVARRMIDASGGFAGVIGTSILPQYFQEFYNSLGLTPDATLALLRPDGAFLIYHPERGQGQVRLSDSPVFRQRISKEPSGLVEVQSVIDGTNRLISFRRIGEMNLIVTISRDRSVILAPWNRLVFNVGATVAGSLVLLFLLLLLALRQIKYRAEAEDRFKAFMDRSPSMAFIKDEVGRYVYVNKTWEEIYARDWRGKTDAEIWPSDSVDMFAESDRRALEAGQATEEFETVLDKKGRPQNWWLMKFPIVDADGKRLLGGMAMDITEQKRKQEELEETHIALTHAMPGIAHLDAQGRYVSLNDAYANILRYAPRELVGQDWAITVHADDLSMALAAYDRMLNGGTGEFEARAVCKDGSMFFNQVLMVKIVDPNGSHVGHRCFMRDITERKEAEADRARLAAIVENSYDAIISRSLDFKVLSWNRAAERMFDYRAEEVIGRATNDFFIPTERQEEVAQKREIIARGESAAPYDTVRLARNGRPVDVSITQSPISDASGRTIAVSLTVRNISERKHAEEALRAAHDELELRVAQRTAELSRSNALLQQKEEQLLLAQQAGHTGLWSRDLASGRSSMSPEWHELMGFSVGEAPVSFADFLARVHPDDRERVKDRSFHQTRGDFDREFRIVHPAKGERWMFSRGRREIAGADGHLHMMGALIDITERKNAEQALRQSEERLQHALAVGRMGTWERDLHTGATKWDLRMYEAFEVEPGTPVSLDAVCARIHPDDLSGIKAAIANTERTGVEYAHEFRVMRTNGQIRWYHVSGGLRYDQNGNATHIAGINFDLTERKHAEQALRLSEERLQHALVVGRMGTWERDLRSGDEKWDRRTYEIFGIESESTVDLYTFFSCVHPEDLAKVRNAVERTESTGADYICEYRVLKPDGQPGWLRSQGGLRHDANGVPTHIAGINFDITERKAAEEALRELNDQLDQRVARRTQELAESQARLRALVAELTQAEERERRRIAVELHDYLAQSLTATRMNLSRADKFVTRADGNSDLKQILDVVQSDLNNSINYTRTLIGELSPRVLYDLGLPVALGWLGEQMGRHGLKVEVDGPREGFSLAEDDSVFLFQCARELLWNVVKHGETDQATVAFGRDGNRVSLAVIDNGKGFDPRTPHTNGGGAHYGLFSIRERVELRGGSVEIDSTPGAGMWVTIVLPLDQSTEVATAMVRSESQQGRLGTAIKIVIVDDHKIVRQGLRRVLEEHDEFTVIGEAGDGAEAIAMARELEPNVVIMDVNLPTMSGIDATQGIVRERPSTIVIGLSFGSDSYVTQAMQAAGAVTCIAKERAVEDVREAILDAVEGRWTLRMEN